MLTRCGLKRVASQHEASSKLAEESRRAPRSTDAVDVASAAPGPAEAPAIDFRAMRREVDAYGAAHLESRKAKRAFQERDLEALGFKSAKAPRTGALRCPCVYLAGA